MVNSSDFLKMNLHYIIVSGGNMSGHSHFATIHRQKELKDAAKGNVFSKLGRAVSIAVRTGGGPDPDSNFKLRIAIEKAREVNMPKENIQRAIDRASGGEVLDEAMYEGFGPGGIGILIETATDNKNRTAAEIKNILDKANGSLAGPGSVSFNFRPKGMLLIKKSNDIDSQMLSLIDAGVEDVEATEYGIEASTSPDMFSHVLSKVKELGYEIESSEFGQKPLNWLEISDPVVAKKAEDLIDKLSDCEDVQKVFSNLKVI